MKLLVRTDTCRGSGECVKVCPEKAIQIVNGRAVIDQGRCDFDGICIPACPHGAIEFEEDDQPGGCGF